MNDSNSSDSEDEKRIMGMSWKKREKQHATDGFREGALAGKDNQFQKSFDRGYADGFQKSHNLALRIGEQRILQFTKQQDRTQPINRQDSMKNICMMCSLRKENVL